MDYKEKAKAYDKALEIAKNIYGASECKDILCTLETIFPELKESVDERIREALIEYFNEQCDMSDWNGVYGYQVVEWLEKQGEQKPTISNNALREGIAHFGITQYQIDNWLKKYVDIEKQGKTHDENSEPKFKVGDWFVNNDTKDVFLIKSFNNGYCTLEDIKGNNISPCLPPCENKSHLWTIQDAKPGDVIVSEQLTILFKKFEEYTDYNFVIAYAGIDVSGKIQITNEHWLISDETKPATSEQRDLLFQKMHESGYEWDAEKKELKKIKKNTAWSEEDEKMLNSIIEDFGDGKTSNMLQEYWLKSLKDRVQPKQEWSEVQPTQEIELFEAEHGKYYYCIKDYFCGGKKQASKGDVVQALRGLPIMGLKDASEYFLPVNSVKCNSTWSEEDESLRRRCIGAIDMANLSDYTKDDLLNWFKCLKDRVQQQPKQEWTDEDNSNLQCCIAKVQHDMNNGWIGRNEELLSWLESLKNRYTWKPSGEQMASIGCAVRNMKESACYDSELVSLFNDLKKLKGEG